METNIRAAFRSQFARIPSASFFTSTVRFVANFRPFNCSVIKSNCTTSKLQKKYPGIYNQTRATNRLILLSLSADFNGQGTRAKRETEDGGGGPNMPQRTGRAIALCLKAGHLRALALGLMRAEIPPWGLIGMRTANANDNRPFF